ncbi:hypothetical protein EDD29_6491 [Actinocorallia herbida]|uniref:DivIVA domain-containing protein n=1 Tax=Actinocorallia herbida TaxID=58109 RepID=A0A3N1D5Q6_9ACTN|nr:hypothetical protein [Actinocorallia herbida]ROO88809.1 hypothetical protein EDD29_6491 [Actinocorallia herbida]
MAVREEPGFSIRLFGYSRREVDDFVFEVRRELRAQTESPGGASVAPSEGAVTRVLRLAAECADQRKAEAAGQAERTLLGARELADLMAAEARERLAAATVDAERILGDARQRAMELEERVSASLDVEVGSRVTELTRAHDRLVEGLASVRDALADVLARDSERGPVNAEDFVPRQQEVGKG